MNIKFFSYIFFISININLFGQYLNLLKKYKKIECQLTPIKIERQIYKNKVLSDTNNLTTSLNWSGYVAATNINDPKTNSVKSVFGSWKVPSLQFSKNSICAIWIGMDGYIGNTIEQIGTAHQMVNGKQINIAWFSLYPDNAFQINNFPVNVNDSIAASVIYQSNNNFLFTIINKTTQQFASIPLKNNNSVKPLRNTAQWIVESVSNLPLAKFDTIDFINCHAIINNTNGNINNNSWQKVNLAMVLSSNVLHNKGNANSLINKARAIPLNLINNGNFKVKWVHEFKEKI